MEAILEIHGRRLVHRVQEAVVVEVPEPFIFISLVCMQKEATAALAAAAEYLRIMEMMAVQVAVQDILRQALVVAVQVPGQLALPPVDIVVVAAVVAFPVVLGVRQRS